jgi:hypothetical protein
MGYMQPTGHLLYTIQPNTRNILKLYSSHNASDGILINNSYISKRKDNTNYKIQNTQIVPGMKDEDFNNSLHGSESLRS